MGAAGLDVIALPFGLADGAAAPSTAVALIPAGQPDVTDNAEFCVPANGFIIGITVQSPCASGDTVVVTPTIGGTAQTPSATATNALPAGFNMLSQSAAIAVTQGQTVGVKYKTTTGGTYGTHDIAAVLYLGVNLNPPNLVTS